MEKLKFISDAIGKIVDFLLKERNRRDNFILALIIVVLAITANYAVIIGVDYKRMPMDIVMDEKSVQKVFNDVAHQVNNMNANDWNTENFEFGYLNINECEYIFSCDSKGLIKECVPSLQYLKGLKVYPPTIADGKSTMILTRSIIAKNNNMTYVYEIWLKKDNNYLCVAINSALIYHLESIYKIDIYLEGIDEDDIVEYFQHGQYSIAYNMSKKKFVIRCEERKKMSETQFVFAKEDEIFKDLAEDILGYIALFGIVFMVLAANSENIKRSAINNSERAINKKKENEKDD